MLRINQEGGELVPVRQVLTEPLGARYDLRRLALSNVDSVFGEIGQRIFVLGRDLKLGPKDDGPRVDILGLDPAGNLLLTFIEPRIEPDDLSNAVRAATAAAPWSAKDFLERLSPGRRNQLSDFLDAELEHINRSQRIVLLSEDYDFDALLGVRMLRERRNMDVLAIHAALAIDYESGQEYMSCSEMSGASLPVVVGLPAPEGAGGLALPSPDEESEADPRPTKPRRQDSGPSKPRYKQTPEATPPADDDDETSSPPKASRVSKPPQRETRIAIQSDAPMALKPFSDLFIDGWKVVGSELDPQPEGDVVSEAK